MKRSTVSILVTAVIVLAGGAIIWFLIVAPRLKPTETPPPPPVVVVPPSEEIRNGALNLYLAPPPTLPEGAARAELTLVAAVISGPGGKSAKVFEGVQRVALQPGYVEKTLSERIPEGVWDRITLTFSPAASLSFADGHASAALIERGETILSFSATIPVSGSLALLAVVPFEPSAAAGTFSLVAAPHTAESYVFGGFMLDPRGIGDVMHVAPLTLAAVIKADLGLDITAAQKGSSGFVPASGGPAPSTP